MSNDTDFEEAAADISERVMVVRDAQLVVTIEKWLNKLTADDRGTNELHYLKLLQYMVANKRIGKPFVRPPPTGPLVPLSRYLNPPPYGARDCSAESWRTSYSSRSVQTVTDDEDDNSGGEYEDETADGNGHQTVADSDTAVLSATAADDHNARDPAAEAAVTKRDGHLAGGGSGSGSGSGGRDECSSCWKSKCGGGGVKPKKAEAGPKNSFPKPCDPCLDDLGRHVQKAQPGPLDADYQKLLGDCKVPVLTEKERKSVSPEMIRVLESVNDVTTLQDFYYQVSLYTCDQGALMIRSSEAMVDDFKSFASDVFESRAEHISDGLAKEQMALSDKYTYLRERELNRATVALDYLRSACPQFNWHKYQADPDAYLRRTVSHMVAMIASGDAVVADGRRTTGSNVDDGDDMVREQSAGVKKLLYSLNWLRTEVSRADCEGQRLHEQRNGMSAELADLNGHLSADRCRASAEVDRLKNELTLLRQQSADQTALIDRQLETIQLLMQNKQSPSVIC